MYWRMKTNSLCAPAADLHGLAESKLGLNLNLLPPLLDERGVVDRIVPISRSTLYCAAGAGEIQTASIGAPGKRGRRLYVTSSVVEWVLRRLDETKRPALAPRKRLGGVPVPKQARVNREPSAPF